MKKSHDREMIMMLCVVVVAIILVFGYFYKVEVDTYKSDFYILNIGNAIHSDNIVDIPDDYNDSTLIGTFIIYSDNNNNRYMMFHVCEKDIGLKQIVGDTANGDEK